MKCLDKKVLKKKLKFGFLLRFVCIEKFQKNQKLRLILENLSYFLNSFFFFNKKKLAIKIGSIEK